MKFCRIDLAKTNYQLASNAVLMPKVQRDACMDQLMSIYAAYCRYKKFSSVMPLFESQLLDDYADVFGYYDNSQLIAFSLVKRHNAYTAESMQFAWDYKSPELHLGLRSIEHECAYYKALGYKHLYLGQVNEYKTKFSGYEQLGNQYV